MNDLDLNSRAASAPSLKGSLSSEPEEAGSGWSETLDSRLVERNEGARFIDGLEMSADEGEGDDLGASNGRV